MRLLLSTDDTILKYNGQYYFNRWLYSLLGRYTAVFTSITLFTRVKNVQKLDGGQYYSIDLNIFHIIEIPSFNNLSSLIKNFVKIVFLINSIDKKMGDVAIVRVPSFLGEIVLWQLKRKRIPYVLEFVANAQALSEIPSDSFLQKLLWKYMALSLKNSATKALANAYVTKNSIQKDFPGNSSRTGYFEATYSSVDINNDFFGTEKSFPKNKTIVLSHIANKFNSNAKGHDILIKVVAKLKNQGYDVVVKCAGTGSEDFLLKLKNLAKDMNVKDNIQFIGFLNSTKELKEFLMSSDIFLFPSRSEGLARSVIEAMAVGLPCVASNVGGIAELLEPNYIIDVEDVDGYVKCMVELINSESKYMQASRYNLENAKQFENRIIQSNRDDFYGKISETITRKREE